MKKRIRAHTTVAVLAILLSLLFLLGGCSDPDTAEPPASEPAVQSQQPAPESPGGEESSDPSPEFVEYNERIAMLTQLYDGQDIIEIPYIEYDGESEELDAINTLFNQGFQVSYEAFLAEKVDGMWMEMKTYPFTSDDYLQIVMTYGVYPSYGTEGYIESVNYDRVSQRLLTLEDALAMAGVTEEDVASFLGKCVIPETRGSSLSTVEIGGFLIRGDAGNETVELLLRLAFLDENGGEWDGLYSYRPDIDDDWDAVTKLSNYCLFDPADMDEMDPPLFYAQNAEPAKYLNDDMVFNSEWINVATGETMTFDQEKFVHVTDAWQTDLEGTYYSFDAEEDPYNIGVYTYGGRSSSIYFNFNPDTQLLVEYAYGEIEGNWRMK